MKKQGVQSGRPWEGIRVLQTFPCVVLTKRRGGIASRRVHQTTNAVLVYTASTWTRRCALQNNAISPLGTCDPQSSVPSRFFSGPTWQATATHRVYCILSRDQRVPCFP